MMWFVEYSAMDFVERIALFLLMHCQLLCISVSVDVCIL